MKSKGCSNWADILISAGWANNEESCVEECKKTAGCNFANFQYMPCGWTGSGGDVNQCFMYNGNCDVERNDCWDLYQIEYPQPLEFQRTGKGIGCSNYEKITFESDVFTSVGECALKCNKLGACKGFDFQPSEYWDCNGEGWTKGGCVLFNGNCSKEKNPCWDLWSKIGERSGKPLETTITKDVAQGEKKVPVDNAGGFFIGQDVMLVSGGIKQTRRIQNGYMGTFVLSPAVPGLSKGGRVILVYEDAVRKGYVPQDDRCPSMVYDQKTIFASTCKKTDYFFCSSSPVLCSDGSTVFRVVARCSGGKWTATSTDQDVCKEMLQAGTPVETKTSGKIAIGATQVPVTSSTGFAVGQDIMLRSMTHSRTRTITRLGGGPGRRLSGSIIQVAPALDVEFAAGARVLQVFDDAVRNALVPQDDRCPVDYPFLPEDWPCGQQDSFRCAFDMRSCEGKVKFSTVARCFSGTWEASSTKSQSCADATYPIQIEPQHHTYWDCKGQTCDQPLLDSSGTCTSAGVCAQWFLPKEYAPQDPMDHGGPAYGENLWMVGKFSDDLSTRLGHTSDDPSCGKSDDSATVKGCGRCVLYQTHQAVRQNWRVVVMKKGTCTSNDCLGKEAFGLAVPGYASPDRDTFNKCEEAGASKAGVTKVQSQAANWKAGNKDVWGNYGDTTNPTVRSRCDDLPEGELRDGCKRFSDWGWKHQAAEDATGKPSYVAVDCPQGFITYISGLYGTAFS